MMEALNDRADSVEFQFSKLTDRVTEIETQNKSLKSDLIDLKSRPVGDNLLVSNLPEKDNETPDTTEKIIREFL